jgi:adenylate cyclase
MCLTRLLHRTGRKTDAEEILNPIYGWFTEGFDTIDLREAKLLLLT